ncbi:MAG: transposase [Hyphomonadaceae bacterium]|nr:transposase [Hyphomonadaceae bacterium]
MRANPDRFAGAHNPCRPRSRCEGRIPNKSNRTLPFAFNKRLYKLRWRIEAAFNRLKDFRRIATRYDKLAGSYLASVCLVAREIRAARRTDRRA